MNYKRFQVQFEALSPTRHDLESFLEEHLSDIDADVRRTGLCRGETEALLAISMTDRKILVIVHPKDEQTMIKEIEGD